MDTSVSGERLTGSSDTQSENDRSTLPGCRVGTMSELDHSLVVLGASSPNQHDFTANSDESSSPFLWLGCALQYMVMTNRLKVHMEKAGSLCDQLDNKRGWRFYTNLALKSKTKMTQKQTLEVKTSDDSAVSVPRAYFGNISIYDLDQMKLGLKMYVRRGLFKRDRLVCAWEISLGVIDSYELTLVWKKVQWHL